jgi:sugar phosphate isomerase/epimerase
MVAASIGTAFALQEEPQEPTTEVDLEELKERVIERLEGRVERLEEALEDLDGEGPLATQLAALFEEGIETYTAAIADVAAAESPADVREIVRDANAEVWGHARVRRLYAHVENDIGKFERRLERLGNVIERADAAGFDTTEAAAEADEADADLAAAAGRLDGIDPSATGPEALEQIRGAHRIAHEGRRHVRAGYSALRNEVPRPEAA